MRRIVVLVGLSLLASLPQAALRAEEPKTVATLIQQLNSDDYWLREEATVELAKAGVESVAELSRAIKGGDLEVAWRALHVLEQQSASDDAATADAAQLALHQLKESSDASIASAADRALSGWRELKQQAALASLREMGAQIDSGWGNMAMMGGMAGMPIPVIVAPMMVEAGGDIELAAAEPGAPVPARRLMIVRDGLAAAGGEVIDLAGGDFEIPGGLPGPLEAPSPVVEVAEPAAGELAGDASPAEVIERVIGVEPGAAPAFAPTIVEEMRAEAPAPAIIAEIPAIEAPAIAATPLKAVFDKVVEAETIVEVDDAIEEAPPVEAPRFDIAVADAIEFPRPAMIEGGRIVFAEAAFGSTPSEQPLSLRLDGNWKGGDAGLAHAVTANNLTTVNIEGVDLTDAAIEHLIKMPALNSLYVRGSKFTSDGLKKLRKARPEVMIMAMGEALVGISGQPHGAGFLVNNVVEGSGAASAGVQLGDVVLSCSGKPIGDISDLTIEIFQRKIGEKVEIEILRGETKQTMTIVLGARP